MKIIDQYKNTNAIFAMGNGQTKNKGKYPLRPTEQLKEQIAYDYLTELTTNNALIKVDDILACPYLDAINMLGHETWGSLRKGFYLIHENFISTNLKKILDVITLELKEGQWVQCICSQNQNKTFWMTPFPRDYETLRKLVYEDLSYAEELIAKTDKVLAELTTEQKTMIRKMDFYKAAPNFMKKSKGTESYLFRNGAKSAVHLSRHPDVQIYAKNTHWDCVWLNHAQIGNTSIYQFCYLFTEEQAAIIMQPVLPEGKVGLAKVNEIIDEISFEPVKVKTRDQNNVCNPHNVPERQKEIVPSAPPFDELEEGAIELRPGVEDDKGTIGKFERQNEQLSEDKVLIDIIESMTN